MRLLLLFDFVFDLLVVYNHLLDFALLLFDLLHDVVELAFK